MRRSSPRRGDVRAALAYTLLPTAIGVGAALALQLGAPTDIDDLAVGGAGSRHPFELMLAEWLIELVACALALITIVVARPVHWRVLDKSTASGGRHVVAMVVAVGLETSLVAGTNSVVSGRAPTPVLGAAFAWGFGIPNALAVGGSVVVTVGWWGDTKLTRVYDPDGSTRDHRFECDGFPTQMAVPGAVLMVCSDDRSGATVIGMPTRAA